jgi:sigma-B regulation protein RsbU (phosphoserine phosphatase)
MSSQPNQPAPPQRPGAVGGISYRTKLVALVCGLVLVTGVAVTLLAQGGARAGTEVLARRLFREVSSHAVSETRNFVLRAGPVVQSLRHLANEGLDLDNSDRLATQLLAVLRANRGLSWVSYGDEAGTFTGAYRTAEGTLRINQSRIVAGRTQLVEYDILPGGRRRLAKRDPDSGYDPRTRPYYRRAKRAGRLVWLPPYVFYNQGVPGVSCSAPVKDAAGRLRGVLSVDFDLGALSKFAGRLSVSEHSRVFLFTQDGVLLADPNWRMKVRTDARGAGTLPTLADTGDPLVDAFRQNLRRDYLRAGDREAFHLFEFEHDGTRYLASATAFRIGGDLVWVVGAVAPREDFLGGVRRSQYLALAASAVALLVAAVLAVLLARRVSGPVLALIRFMRKVGEGDLNARPDFGGSREFRQLQGATGRMIADLRDRLRLRHSLDVAMEVQQQLLPRSPPRVWGLDIAGHSTYCDETGGDYYDFLHLEKAAPAGVLVALGDVMGHGVAAALVMAGARAVLHDRAGQAGGLAELLGRLNRLLTADLEGTRFMTMHLSVLDARAGTFRWVSAGHDPALIFNPAAGRFEEIDEAGVPLGIVPGTEYAEHEYGPLRPGMVITVGTDGIWEMPNAAGERFGKDRLRKVIRGAAAGTAEDIARAVLDDLTGFRGACRAADDVTFVVVKVLEVGTPAGTP